MKNCKYCKILKEETNFYKSKTSKDKLSSFCKRCQINRYYKATPNKIICKVCRVSLNENNGRNSGHKRKDGSIIFANNCKVCFNEYLKKYNKNHRKNNIDIRLREAIKVGINKKIKTLESNKINKYLGYSIKEYKLYLEQKFTDKMNWENYGDYWEIDHILPLSKGGSFHYTNTQPLTVTENRKKGNKL
jgi:5-methylcytosine-specific restriction endonuclease McrA